MTKNDFEETTGSVNADQSNPRVFVIRHAQSGYSPKIGETVVTSFGRRYAQRSARFLIDYCKDNNLSLPRKIVTSPLYRAVQTAEIYAKVLGLQKSDIVIDNRLAERTGRFDNPNVDVSQYSFNENSVSDNAEDLFYTGQRFQQAIYDNYDDGREEEITNNDIDEPCEIKSDAEHESILFVSHLNILEEGIYRIISKHAENSQSTLYPMNNCGLAVLDKYEFKGKYAWRLVAYGLNV